MIVDVVRTKGIPYKCENCDTYFAWKPDKQGECRLLYKGTQCKKPKCKYYEPAEKKCPECGSTNIVTIFTTTYKLKRWIRRKN